jgi:hypothetical protein
MINIGWNQNKTIYTLDGAIVYANSCEQTICLLT